MKQYKAAIVGYGGMGRWHVQGIHKTDRVVFKGPYALNPERWRRAKPCCAKSLYPCPAKKPRK